MGDVVTDKDLRYTVFGDRELIPGPFLCTGGEFRTFLLKVDSAALRGLVSDVLTANDEDEREFHPLSDIVLLNVSYTEKMYSSAPPKEVALDGYISEFQTSIAVPLVVGSKQNPGFWHEKMMMVIPYIVVNNPVSLCSGRETYGYPKSLGQFVLNGDRLLDPGMDPPEDWRKLGLSVSVFGGSNAPDQRAKWTPLIELKPPDETVEHEHHWHAVEDVAKHFLPPRLGAEAFKIAAHFQPVPFSLFSAALRSTTRYVFLKQFRSHNDSDAACYKKVIQAPLEVDVLHGGLSQEWTVALHPVDSHPILEDFGLEPDPELGYFEQRLPSIVLDMNYKLGIDRD